MKERREYTFLDRCLDQLNQALEVSLGPASQSQRPNPAQGIAPATLDEAQRRHVAGLMRINHAGEVCAQALYAGQAITARSPQIQTAMQRAAAEEWDHLAWCADRLAELNSHRSRLGLFWYGGSFTLGCLAGALGDRWNLGFLQETERQVEAHLDGHLEQLPESDERSRRILEQMKLDEAEHAAMAEAAGAAQLPAPIPALMAGTAKVMKALVYRI